MRGQRVISKGSLKTRMEGTGSTVGGVGASTVGSLVGAMHGKPTKLDANTPTRTACGTSRLR